VNTLTGSQPAPPGEDRLLADWGDNCTLELARIVKAWHSIGLITGSGPTCKHCMPTTAWPCPAWRTAQEIVVSLTRDEPYGPPPGNAYLQYVMDVDAARAEALAREVTRNTRPEAELMRG
jgi:hypothetical protein